MKSFTFLLTVSCIHTSTGFSAPLRKLDFFGSIQSIFRLPNDKQNPSSQTERRDALKSILLSECSQKGVPREQVEELIYELADFSPIRCTASSDLLQKKWLLLWTTEKEINFFIDWKLSSQITQTIDRTLLENNIPFVRGGSFGVKGNLSIPNTQGIRTTFQFTTANLDLGSWGSFNFPPVGEGWFDTIYLDDDLRVDTNSRNDILICVPFPSNS